MVEDIGKIISNGFETYTNNLNLGIPFVLNVIITGLAFIILGFGFLTIFGSSLSSLENATTPQEVLSIIIPLVITHLTQIIILLITFFLISLAIQSFFNAGAIGMARQATETGKTGLSAMVEAGKKNVVNLFMADVLLGLLSLAGIVFIVPGALKFDINQLLFPEKTGASLLLIAGILLWVLYLLILGLMLAVFRYALVVDNLEPIDGIVTGFNFFKKNKSDVFVLWLILGIIIVAITIIGELMRFSPVMNLIWPLVNVFISVFIVAPLTTVFWVRLYMTRTGKEVYFNDLLAHPNDLAKLKSDQ
ncbi:MAG: hypothetical protein O8C64_00035 [Candidatus Methanoperedens sp.]|nr:hypothetical protein [Candidatus Methanoperedens sp.]